MQEEKKWYNRIELNIATLLMFIMLVMLTVQVVGRYFFKVSWGEIDELARYGLIWLAYLSAIWATFKDIQIKVDILLKVWPQKIRKGIKWLSLIIFFVYCVVVGYYSATWVIDVAKVGTSSIALGVPMVYFQCIIPIAHFLMAIRLIQVGLRYRKHPELLEEKSEDEEFAEFMSVAKGGADE